MLIGIVDAIFGGTPIPLKPGSTFNLGGLVGTPQAVGTAIDVGMKMEASEIKLKVAMQKGFPVYATFPAGVQKELQLNCDNGTTYVWENAFRSGTINITTGDNSEADVTMAGGTPQELINS